MSRTSLRRLGVAGISVLVPAVLLGVVTAPEAAGAAAAPAPTVQVTISAVSSATVTATARVSAGAPAITATARATARSSARGVARVRERVRSLGGPANGRDHARALKAAFKAARLRAVARARTLARQRAHAAAVRSARATALAAARSRATRLAVRAAGPGGTCGGVALPKPDGTAWSCSFDDEFDGTSLDRTKWSSAGTAETGLSAGGGCFVDTPDTIAVGGGVLRLSVREEPEPFTCHSPLGDYTTQYVAGQVTTAGHFAQAYGRVAVRAKFPAATIAGLQSSLWLWGQNNRAIGRADEIDIAEEFSQYADRAIPYLHYDYDPSTTNASTDVNVPTTENCLVRDVNAFHEYAVEWSPGTVKVLFDGRTCLLDHYLSLGGSAFDQPFFLLLTQTLGITTNAYQPGRTPLPATTQVDWVRVWK